MFWDCHINMLVRRYVYVIAVVYTHMQLVDGETLREWLAPAYVNPDGTGFSFPWELVPLGNYTLRTKDGVMNGYNAEFQMAVRTFHSELC